MINAWNKLKEQILKPVEVENEYHPPLKSGVKSTIDMGAGMTTLEKHVHRVEELNRDWIKKMER